MLDETARLMRASRVAAGAALFGALVATVSALAAAPMPVRVAPGVYALMEQQGEIAPANAGRVANVALTVQALLR